MSNHTYIGYINKTRLLKVMSRVYFLKNLADAWGPSFDCREDDATRYLISQAHELIDLGSLDFLPDNLLYNFLKSATSENHSSYGSIQFCFLSDLNKHFFYQLSCVYQQMFIKNNSDFKEILETIISNNYQIDLTRSEGIVLKRYKQFLDKEEDMLRYSNQCAQEDNIYNCAPYDENQFNYLAVETFLTMRDKDFDYDNKQLCYWRY